MRLFWLLLLLTTAAQAETLTIESVRMHQVDPVLRPAVDSDPVDRALALGTWEGPGEDWTTLQADEDGWIVSDSLHRGYAYAEIEVDEDSTWILEAMGYVGVYVNGEPRIGNTYGYTHEWESWQPRLDFSFLPVNLKAGENQFLFFGSRHGLMQARLHRAEADLSINVRDTTVPDLLVGEEHNTMGALVVLNATAQAVASAVLRVTLEGSSAAEVVLPLLPPYSVRKVGFPIRGRAKNELGPQALNIDLIQHEEVIENTSLELQVKRPDENRRVTFVSEIDGSVQYYGYLPPRVAEGTKGLVLSLHGASVEAINQSGSYAQHDWMHLVAPTNRRPFGFSWEDWGRLDALEVLALAQRTYAHESDRTYLTGHSMGGHGSWHLSTLYPDKFAAVGPSAGWITIWSYRRGAPEATRSPLIDLVERATLPSQTLAMAPNLDDMGVYVLHGGIDDNVPPEQAHLMVERLNELGHEDLVYHEEPDVNHWWDLSDDPGADCVSWPAMFDFFTRHRKVASEEVLQLEFQTPSPTVSAQHHWATIYSQAKQFEMSKITLDRSSDWARIGGTTENVELLGIDCSRANKMFMKIELDGDVIEASVVADGMVWLQRDEHWIQTTEPNPAQKGPHRGGTFREAFNNRTQLVYATGGNDADRAWAFAKARYDAEYIWYQGNGAVDVIADTMFVPHAEPDRNAVLYGNADTHEDWDAMVGKGFRVMDDRIEVGGRAMDGQDFALLAVCPRPGSRKASVGFVSATGAQGQRLLNRRPYLILGVSYPDITVFEVKNTGSLVRGAGFYDNDWSLAAGEFLWSDHE